MAASLLAAALAENEPNLNTKQSSLTSKVMAQRPSLLADSGSICTDWGRCNSAGNLLTLGSVFMMTVSPFFVLFIVSTIAHYDGSLWASSSALFKALQNVNSISDIHFSSIVPPITLRSIVIYSVWMCIQLALWFLVPGPTAYGQLTPAGHTLKYKVNGLNCWIVTHALLAIITLHFQWFSASVLYDEWLGLFSVANVFGFGLTFFAYFKSWLAPSHAKDCKWSGSWVYDMFMGVEFNPRLFGDRFDFKLFFNGRPGIIAWTLINGSMACKQLELHGYISHGMIAVNILQALYVLDFFKNESWYLRTIDICHDHFGFYLAWGDCVWLPYTYTLQAYYLVQHPEQLPVWAVIGIYLLGFTGYTLFRLTNAQKDSFRAKKGECNVWGKPATFIRASYHTGQGEKRESLLLTSGFWGLSRHFNYVGDLMLSLSFCLACGFDNLLPYWYIIYMTLLLVHRVGRDDARCRAKYGEKWNEYCKRVPWQILPGVY